MHDILQLKNSIMTDHGGVRMLCANSVARSIEKLSGTSRDARSARFQSAMIQALGKGGLDLPNINKNSRTRYAINLAGASEEETGRFKNHLASLTEKQFENLEVS